MQLAQNNVAMDQAWGVIKCMSADEKERAEAEAVEKARRDMVARLRSAELKGLLEGKKAGLEEGKKAGLEEGQQLIIGSMLAQDLTFEQISKLTRLPLDVVTSLAAKAKNLQ